MPQNLEHIDRKIKDFKDKHQLKQKGASDSKNNSLSFNIGCDVAANILVGLVLGILLDKFFNSKPIGLLFCLIISVLAAFKVIVDSKNKL
jgi:ATP synthase protein I